MSTKPLPVAEVTVTYEIKICYVNYVNGKNGRKIIHGKKIREGKAASISDVLKQAEKEIDVDMDEVVDIRITKKFNNSLKS